MSRPAGGGKPPPGRLTARQRSALAIALTGIAGSVDAIGYIVLFHVFTANMTGNTVALGMGLVQHDWLLAARRGFAIPMFLLGMLWSRVIVHVAQLRQWRHSATVLFGCEALLLACFGILGLLVVPGGRVESSSGALYFLLVALLSLPMGIQNASLSHFGPLSVRTTHVTGNLATLADEMAKFGIWFHESWRRIGLARTLAESSNELSFRETLFLSAVWVSYFAGAVVGAALLAFWHLAAVFPGVLALLALVLVDWVNPVLAASPAAGRRTSAQGGS
jgi:uncharacterized membrane protein YoaK (UPF0700 family)